MKNKKGQVTLFIILGIVVLIIVGIAVFIISLNKNQIPDEVYENNYDARLAPIYNDVVFCTSLLGKEAIIKIGETGGYTEVRTENYRYSMPYAYDNDALELFPDSGIVLPYWNYIGEDPDCVNCVVSQNYPLLTGEFNSIQNNIELYIEKNLMSCLDNFSAYKFDLDIKYSSSPVCNVELRDENVFIGVSWPLEVTFVDGTKSSSLKTYSTTLDVKLKKIYEFALNILYQTEMMEDSRQFESFTNDIISFYSFGGQDAIIPPVSGPTVFQFTAPKIWLQQNVQETLKTAVAETIPYMQVVGTKDSFIMNTNDTIKSNFYSNFQNVVYYDDEFASQIRVRFNYYPIWPFYVSVGPNDGPVIMPESSVINMWLIKLSTTRYRFYYDISYPVMVTLEDDSAFGGEGYTFNYAFEVNLKDNSPYSNETVPVENYMQEQQPVESLGYTQRTVPVSINVINGYTNMPVNDVTVSYTCVDKEYLVGTSKIDKNRPNAIIESYLAPCLGGTFTISSEGFGESPINKDILLDEPVMMDYKVYPQKQLNLELRKRSFAPTVAANPTAENPSVDRQWELSSGEGSTSVLEKDEEITVIMSEIKQDGSAGNTIFLQINDTNSKVIDVVPGKYSVDIMSTVKLGENYNRMNITIPKRTIKMKGEDVVINETVINNVMYLGGLTIDESKGYLVITPEMLASKSSLLLYFPTFRLSDEDTINEAGYINTTSLKYVEDLNVLGKINEAPLIYPELFVPSFE